MKNEDSKLLLGLGLGALAGATIGYLMTGENRKRLEKDLCKTGDDIKETAQSAYSKMKCKAEHAGSKFAEKTSKYSEKAGKKANEWSEKAGDKANEWSGKVSNKANEWSDEMEEKAQEDAKGDAKDEKNKGEKQSQKTT